MSMTPYIRKTLARIGEEGADNSGTIEKLAREAWEALVLMALYSGQNEEIVVFKGGSLLRLIYGSDRMSSDLDFDEPADPGKEDWQTVRRMETALRRAEGLLYDFGFRNIKFSVTKDGDGTVRFKVAADIPLSPDYPGTLKFNSKIEISRRGSRGLDAVAESYGAGSVMTEAIPDVPSPLLSEVPKIRHTFVKTYTPLAMFLMKMNAVSDVKRLSTRDVYDLAYIWNNLGLGDPGKREFVMDCIKVYVREEMNAVKRKSFLPLLKEKGERFSGDLEKGEDLFFYGGKDEAAAGLFVLEFVEEFSALIGQAPDTGLVR